MLGASAEHNERTNDQVTDHCREAFRRAGHRARAHAQRGQVRQARRVFRERSGYIVTSAVGHLLEIKAPEEFDVKRGKWSFAHLPVIPPHFDLVPIDKTKTRLNAIVRLVKRKDVSELINACDAGREGELIFRLIQQYAKGKQPVKRLWLQSMTPQAIRDGFEHLRSDQQMLPLADAARCRSEADWLVGINGTRAMTAFNSRDGGFFLTTVGRVQTPTLSIMVEREEQIRKHVSRDYWEVRATFAVDAGEYEGKWFDPAWKKNPDDAELRSDRLWNEADALAIAAAVQGEPATVSEEAKPSTQAPPLLYDLTSLQREANSRFGFSARTTLSIAQALYEKHKVLTYPRTDSRASARGLRRGRQGDHRDDLEGGPAGPAARARGAREDRAQGGLRQADQEDLRQRQGVGPLRDHPDPAGAEEPLGDRGQALRHGCQALPRGVLPAGRVHGDDADLERRQGRQGLQVPDQRQGDGASPAGSPSTAARRRRTMPTWSRSPMASSREPKASTSRR